MNEKPKSIWKKSLGQNSFLVSLFVAAVASTIIVEISSLRGLVANVSTFAIAWVVLVLFFWSLIKAIRWMWCWRNFKRFLFGLACFITLIALFYAEEDWRGWHTWNQFKHTWEAKGQHFDMADVVPLPVPEDQNFALTPIAYTSYGYILTRDGKRIPNDQRDTNFVQRIRMPITHNYKHPDNADGNREKGTFTDLKAWQSYYRDLAAKTNEFAVPAQPESPAADVLLALSKYDGAIEELRTASRLPYSRFPLNYDSESPGAILLPQLTALRGCAQVLQLRSLAELQKGEPDKALADIELSLQLTGKISTEPILITHLVRIAMLQITLQPVLEGLAEHKWSDEQLVALDGELAKLDFFAAYKLSMDGELACQNGEANRLRRHPEELRETGQWSDDEGNSGTLSNPDELIARLIPAGWFYQNQYRCARIMVNYFIPVADTSRRIFSPALARQGYDKTIHEIIKPTPFNFLERLMLPSLANAAARFAYAQASVDLARTAIALERYLLAHGEYPETLDTLAPQLIAQVPHDVIGGQPLKYRREADGLFVLYSIGWNETDDGGVVVFYKNSSSRVDFNQGDWVWRYPAK